MLPVIIVGVAFWGSVIGGGFYLARRLVRAAEQRNGEGTRLGELSARVSALEEALDGARRDIDRLETGLEFTTRLLGSRASTGERHP